MAGSVLQRQVAAVKAVDGVSFTLNRGETLGLVGESGCGKSTTGLAVLRMLDIDRRTDRVRRRATSPATTAPACAPIRKRMQMVYQDPFGSLNPRMKVARPDRRAADRAPHAAEPRGARGAGAASCWTWWGCGRTCQALHRTSSRAGSASASASPGHWRCSRTCSICDEPVSALDVSIQAQIVNLFQDLQQRARPHLPLRRARPCRGAPHLPTASR